ncbi:hypothetical protein UY3_13915 [Chelonia mydas]|uniref:Uncharacterized protein n=1 Tax=Chelonia mydas TaxID=8469 RepID=M7B0P4_CHEMY|nr:hypothetical protein UY3_13915 [Chelonia mydas]
MMRTVPASGEFGWTQNASVSPDFVLIGTNELVIDSGGEIGDVGVSSTKGFCDSSCRIGKGNTDSFSTSKPGTRNQSELLCQENAAAIPEKYSCCLSLCRV